MERKIEQIETVAQQLTTLSRLTFDLKEQQDIDEAERLKQSLLEERVPMDGREFRDLVIRLCSRNDMSYEEYV